MLSEPCQPYARQRRIEHGGKGRADDQKRQHADEVLGNGVEKTQMARGFRAMRSAAIVMLVPMIMLVMLVSVIMLVMVTMLVVLMIAAGFVFVMPMFYLRIF